jgi:hypothetical protein
MVNVISLSKSFIFLLIVFLCLPLTGKGAEASDSLSISPIGVNVPVVITSCNESEISYLITTNSYASRKLTMHNVINFPGIVDSYEFNPTTINTNPFDRIPSQSILTLKLYKIVSGMYEKKITFHVRGTAGNNMIGVDSDLYVTELQTFAVDPADLNKELESPIRLPANTPYNLFVKTTPYPTGYPIIVPFDKDYPDDYMHFSYSARKHPYSAHFNSAHFTPQSILGTGGPGFSGQPGLSAFSFITPSGNDVGRFEIVFSSWYGENQCNIVHSKPYLLDIFDKPSVHSDSYDNLHSSGVRLIGTVHPKWSKTNVWFEYGTTPTYGRKTAGQLVEYHQGATQVVDYVDNLMPDTTYYFRFAGRNEHETIVYGEEIQFTTPSSTWLEIGPGIHGADLVSDGTTLFRIGGIGHCRSIDRFDGNFNEWTRLTDSNPQCYGHYSPGEGNRSWYYDGKIICAGHSHPGHPGGNKVTMYDIAADSWTIHELPFLGGLNAFIGGQFGALNAVSGDVYLSWSEWGSGHDYLNSALDIESGAWGTPYDRDSRIGQGTTVLEDTSGQFVFDLIRGDRYVELRVYDLYRETGDFSGAWNRSSIYDLGEENFFMYLDRNYGSDVMAWSFHLNKLYLVSSEHGVTLEYDPYADRWRELARRPIGHGYRDGHLVAVGDRLYSQNHNKLWVLKIP